ncbi:molybdopterin molybdotransferase MoeA [Flagellimonas flava]|uniref:Molybdopterin molybdenumtransferase n=1 Tax=Flagellimonas flava TaxID=570519 RepID=A0A1M5ISR7_9FLAO|nr:molybdopterin molybdotransferase MoeA [Allomuricauda flava]SHG31357.1 molybdopterin molybdochelatase [Allomuricauda flava]
MISFETAFQKVMAFATDYGTELVPLKNASGRVLAEIIAADRDFPPFDRSTKDGIAIKFTSHTISNRVYSIAGLAQAGSPQQELLDTGSCIEVMTGAMVPKGADTVIMYEHLSKSEDGRSFTLEQEVKKGQNIHYQGSDTGEGESLLPTGTVLGPAEIGVLASVGKSMVLVKKLPRIAVISTGNELVDVDQTPRPYQIRKSNVHSLQALLGKEHVVADEFHFQDSLEKLKQELQSVLDNYDVVLLSGGVSKGKFDFLPEAFEALGVTKAFHKVLQRPGKPFWFGRHNTSNTVLFSFPGNPVSTYANYHIYFIPWLNKTLGVHAPGFDVFLDEALANTTDLTLFIGVSTNLENGKLIAQRISTTGSGDLLALAKYDGFVKIYPGQKIEKNALVPFVPTKPLGE